MAVSETILQLATDAIRETRLRMDAAHDAPDPATERAYDEFLARACLTAAALSDQVMVPIEVRKQNGAIDEIIIKGGTVHIEQMSGDGWFMGVNAADDSYWQFWFGSKNRKTPVEFCHTETVPASTPVRSS